MTTHSQANFALADHSDLKEFVQELACIPGLLAARMEYDSGPSASIGLRFDEFPMFESWGDGRAMILSWLSGEQDFIVLDWGEFELGVYRVGRSSSLWVCCNCSESQALIQATWKRRRGPWALRTAPDEEPDALAETSSGWRRGLGERLESLLEGTAREFVALRGAEGGVTVAQAESEFESLGDEWASFCEPSVVSFPMLLDSLRQCLSDEGDARSTFFERMQRLMAA